MDIGKLWLQELHPQTKYVLKHYIIGEGEAGQPQFLQIFQLH